MFGILLENSKSTWRDLVGTLVHTYNCTSNNTTEFNPYYMMFGRKPKLPVDFIFWY